MSIGASLEDVDTRLYAFARAEDSRPFVRRVLAIPRSDEGSSISLEDDVGDEAAGRGARVLVGRFGTAAAGTTGRTGLRRRPLLLASVSKCVDKDLPNTFLLVLNAHNSEYSQKAIEVQTYR